MIHSVEDCGVVQLPKIHDLRGNLTFVEEAEHLPFEIRRAYWIYAVPGGETRGGHAYHELHEMIIALSGSFEVVLDDGRVRNTVLLNRSYMGLYVPNMIWRELVNFSTNAVCLILASNRYSESDYLRHYSEFLRVQEARR